MLSIIFKLKVKQPEIITNLNTRHIINFNAVFINIISTSLDQQMCEKYQ